jgi:HPt (histidine-containing phosphotransfer) domain-containing protein
VDALPEKVSDLQSLWDRLQSSNDQEVLKTLSRSAHNLAGSAGTFGFPVLSEKARGLEKILVQLQADYELGGSSKERITHLLNAINQLARQGPE